MPELPGRSHKNDLRAESAVQRDTEFYFIGGIFSNESVATMREAANALGIQMVSLTGSGGVTEDNVPVKENEMQIVVKTKDPNECTRFWAKVDELTPREH
jgi:hypothetical protein